MIIGQFPRRRCDLGGKSSKNQTGRGYMERGARPARVRENKNRRPFQSGPAVASGEAAALSVQLQQQRVQAAHIIGRVRQLVARCQVGLVQQDIGEVGEAVLILFLVQPLHQRM